MGVWFQCVACSSDWDATREAFAWLGPSLTYWTGLELPCLYSCTWPSLSSLAGFGVVRGVRPASLSPCTRCNAFCVIWMGSHLLRPPLVLVGMFDSSSQLQSELGSYCVGIVYMGPFVEKKSRNHRSCFPSRKRTEISASLLTVPLLSSLPFPSLSPVPPNQMMDPQIGQLRRADRIRTLWIWADQDTILYCIILFYCKWADGVPATRTNSIF